MYRIVLLAAVLNLLYVAVEASVGFWQGSTALLSDAGHNLSDVLSLVLVLIAFRHRDKERIVALINALLLLAAVLLIIAESVRGLVAPVPVNGAAVSWTAAVGILVNGLTVLLLNHGRSDLNVRSAFLHMLADTLVSVGVVISGIVIAYTGWTVVDPIVSLAVALLILIPSVRLLREILHPHDHHDGE